MKIKSVFEKKNDFFKNKINITEKVVSWGNRGMSIAQLSSNINNLY